MRNGAHSVRHSNANTGFAGILQLLVSANAAIVSLANDRAARTIDEIRAGMSEMRTREEKIDVVLRYEEGDERPSEGFYEGGVQDPSFVDELLLWVAEREVFDETIDDFRSVPGGQVNLCGSPRALFELGRYLIALSRLDSKNQEYRDYFDGLSAPEGQAPAEFVVHAPSRIRKQQG